MHMVEAQVRRRNAHGDKRYSHGSMSSNLTIIDNTITSMNCPNIHSILNEIFQIQWLQKNMDN